MHFSIYILTKIVNNISIFKIKQGSEYNNMKKLTLRIAKFTRMLVVEQLERTGEWENSEHVMVYDDFNLFTKNIHLQKDNDGESNDYRIFDDNAKRDEYVENLIKWITEEQFGSSMKLEIGKMCEVSDNGKEWVKRIFAGKSAKQLIKEKRFLGVNLTNNDSLHIWKYAKPINDGCNLTINGEIYTWEIK